MLSAIKKIIPASTRHYIRQKIDEIKLSNSIRPLRENGSFTPDELASFHRAWGNEGFSADRRYLAEIIKLIEKHGGPVLECGTGATTILAGVLAERFNFDVYSLEQDSEWSIRARHAVKHNDLKRVHILDTPLKKSNDYMWYDVSGVALPKHFGVIVCDGPFIDQAAGDSIYRNWRYGVLPFLRQSGSTFNALLLDDVNDHRAKAVLDKWRVEFNTAQDIVAAPEGDCAIVRTT